jgi:hypothetical protein
MNTKVSSNPFLNNLIIITAGIFVCLFVGLFVHLPKVAADSCGVHAPSSQASTNWEGAVVAIDLVDQHGNTTQVNNEDVQIWSVGTSNGAYPTDNAVEINSSQQEIGNANTGSSSNSPNGAAPGASVTFSQVGTGWAGCSSGEDFGHSSAVILGYGNTSPCVSGCGGLNNTYNWALRCGTLEGNEQTFYYAAVGTPPGAITVNGNGQHGYWSSNTMSYPAQGGTGNNGATDSIILTYHDAPPYQPPTGGSATASPGCYDTTVNGSGLASNQEVQVNIVESTSPSSNGTGPSSPGPTLYSTNITYSQVGSGAFSKREPPGSAFYYPNEQYVFVDTDVATHSGSTWSYGNYTWGVSGPCYSAGCYIDSVTGDLPNGYIQAGGTANVTATIYNNSPTGLALPGNDQGNGIGSGADVLNMENAGGGVNGGFSNITNVATGLPYAGSIPYPYSSDTSVTETFTTTVSGSGTIEAEAGYVGSGSLLLSNNCTFPISTYQGPTVNAAVACNGSVSGTASDPYVSGGFTINIYVDSPSGPPSGPYASVVTDNYGNYSWSVPSALQDGNDHTFYVYVVDPLGIQNGEAPTVVMTGCESFHVTPGANGAQLLPSPEDPTSFGKTTGTDTSVDVAYGPNSNTYYGSAPGNTSFPGTPVGANYYYTVNGGFYGAGPSGAVPSASGNTIFSAGTSSPPWAEASYLAPVAPVTTIIPGNVYCLVTNVSPSDGFIQNNGVVLSSTTSPNPDTQTSCDTEVNRPFYKAQNSSVLSGGAFASTGSCSSSGTGELEGWNNDTGSDYGASSQNAAIAFGPITGFASNQSVENFSSSPTALTFANTSGITSDPYVPSLGGNFEPGGSYCLSDPVPGATAQTFAGNTDIDSLTNMAPGTDLYYKVNGNVYIGSNITYSNPNSSWGSNNVPSFVLDATGNIYIDPSVTELDGIYVSHGNIYTCGAGNSSVPNYVSPMSSSQLFTNCSKQLAVYGSFVANHVEMERTFGSLRDETPVPGSPGSPATPPSGATGATTPLVWSQNRAVPGDTCVALNEPSDPTATWSNPNDNYLCIPTADSGLNLAWTHAAGSGATPSTDGGDPGDVGQSYYQSNGYPDCASFSGVNNAPWFYPSGNGSPNYTWADNDICSNVPISVFEDTRDPASDGTDPSGQCNFIAGQGDAAGNGILGRGFTWVCVATGSPASPGSPATPGTPASAPILTTCSNWDGVAADWSIRNTCSAEVFILSPELYLSTPAVEPPGNGVQQYDSVTGLPPVL